MGVVEAAEREIAEIAKRDPVLAASALAASALELARGMDGDNSLTSKSMAGREMRDTLDRLRDLAPEEEASDKVDDIARQRAKRRAGVSAG